MARAGAAADLAVAFIMGLAFAAVVTAFNGTPIPYGALLTAIVSFLIVAWALFLLVKAYQRVNPPKEEPTTTEPCDYCRTDIPIDAVRSPNRTSQLVTATS